MGIVAYDGKTIASSMNVSHRVVGFLDQVIHESTRENFKNRFIHTDPLQSPLVGDEPIHAFCLLGDFIVAHTLHRALEHHRNLEKEYNTLKEKLKKVKYIPLDAAVIMITKTGPHVLFVKANADITYFKLKTGGVLTSSFDGIIHHEMTEDEIAAGAVEYVKKHDARVAWLYIDTPAISFNN